MGLRAQSSWPHEPVFEIDEELACKLRRSQRWSPRVMMLLALLWLASSAAFGGIFAVCHIYNGRRSSEPSDSRTDLLAIGHRAYVGGLAQGENSGWKALVACMELLTDYIGALLTQFAGGRDAPEVIDRAEKKRST